MDITHAQLVPVPNPALEMKKRKSSKERESIFGRIIVQFVYWRIFLKLNFKGRAFGINTLLSYRG